MAGRTRRASAEDCNPLHRRVPAEIVSRRKPVQVADADDDTITVDRKTVFLLKPERRQKWLTKALKLAAEGEVHTSDVYDIVASTRFAEDLPYKLGQKMSKLVQHHLSLFSAKQQKFLSSEASLHVKFGQLGAVGKDTENESVGNGEKKDKKGADLEDMMARCRAFVREKAMERGEVSGVAEGEAASELQEADKNASGANESSAKPAKKDKKRKHSSSSRSSSRRKRGRSKTRKDSKKTGDEKKKKKQKSSSSSSSAKKSKAKDNKRQRPSSSSSSSSSKEKKKQHRKSKSSSSTEASKSKKRKRSESSRSKRRQRSKSAKGSKSPKRDGKKKTKK